MSFMHINIPLIKIKHVLFTYKHHVAVETVLRMAATPSEYDKKHSDNANLGQIGQIKICLG